MSHSVFVTRVTVHSDTTQLNSTDPVEQRTSQSCFCLWRHDLQTESTVVHAVELISVELSCRYKHPFGWQSHVWQNWVAHPVFLSDVLNDVIGVTSNCRLCSIQLPYAILPRLRFTTCVFSKTENLGRFYDPPVWWKLIVSFSFSSHLLRCA